MIEAVALLNQHRRNVDGQGRVIAELSDYALTARVLRKPIVESLGVRARPRCLYQRLVAKFKATGFFLTTEAQGLDDAEERTVRSWLQELAAAGADQKDCGGAGPEPGALGS